MDQGIRGVVPERTKQQPNTSAPVDRQRLYKGGGGGQGMLGSAGTQPSVNRKSMSKRSKKRY